MVCDRETHPPKELISLKAILHSQLVRKKKSRQATEETNCPRASEYFLPKVSVSTRKEAKISEAPSLLLL